MQQVSTPIVKDDDKIRILTLSDHPLSPSGIGIQAHQLITGLLDTGKYRVFSIGAAVKHDSHQPQILDKYKEDWIIFPVDGFGDPNSARQWMTQFQPNAVLLFTNPRFFLHMFSIEEEIRDMAPILFWTVWDNDPAPSFNKKWYDCCDDIAFFSRFSHSFHKKLEPKVDADFHAIPLARDPDIFHPLTKSERKAAKVQILGWEKRDSFLATFVSRNARRKRPGDIISAWKMFLEMLPEDQRKDPTLLMHCDPNDQEGPNLHEVIEKIGVEETVLLSTQKCSNDDMNRIYNISDVVVNFSLNEGFGMSVHESLLAGTPVIATSTGGITEQMRDEDGKEFGILLEPEHRMLVGSQLVPYIYEDIVSNKTLAEAFYKFYTETDDDQRDELGLAGREFLLEHNKVEDLIGAWDEIITRRVEEYANPERIRAKLLEI